MKLRITILKYHSWYLCQISLQIMLLPILISWINIHYQRINIWFNFFFQKAGRIIFIMSNWSSTSILTNGTFTLHMINWKVDFEFWNGLVESSNRNLQSISAKQATTAASTSLVTFQRQVTSTDDVISIFLSYLSIHPFIDDSVFAEKSLH